jgi:hypothetical protein
MGLASALPRRHSDPHDRPPSLRLNQNQCSVANIQGLSVVLRLVVFADKQGEDKLASALGGGLRPKLLWVRVGRIAALHFVGW